MRKLKGKRLTRDAVFKLINPPQAQDPDKWKLADLQKVIAYEDRAIAEERRGTLVHNVSGHLDWLYRTLQNCSYHNGPIDLLTRMLGSEFHNFYQNGTEYICSGKDVHDREEHVVYGEDGPRSLRVFEKKAFFAYLDFALKVFVHEFYALPRLAQEVLIAQNVVIYKTGQSQKQVLENMRVPVPEHLQQPMKTMHKDFGRDFTTHSKTAAVRRVAGIMHASGLYASELMLQNMHEYAKINADLALQERAVEVGKK